MRQIFTYQQAAVTLPDSEQRAGVFLLHRVDGTTAPIPLYNPITGTTYTSGNIASASTPFALGVLAALPANNVTGANGSTAPAYNNITNNYSNAPRGTINDDKGDARIDQSFAKWKLFGRYSEHQAEIFDPPTVGGPAGGNANSNVNIQNRQIAGGATWIISQNKLLDIRFAWTRNIGAKTPYTQGQPSLSGQVRHHGWTAHRSQPGPHFECPVDHWFHAAWKPALQSAVPESHHLQPEDQLHLGTWPSLDEVRL